MARPAPMRSCSRHAAHAGPAHVSLPQIASAIKTDLLETTSDVKRSAPYAPPAKRGRENRKSTTIDINEWVCGCACRPPIVLSSESGVVLHSSSKWGTAWKNFRENNAVVNSALHACCGAWLRRCRVVRAQDEV